MTDLRVPAGPQAQRSRLTRIGARALIGRSREGERIQVGPGAVTIQATAADSDGRLAVIEYDVAPGFPGPPLHVHPFDEFFYVLEGEVTFGLGDSEVTLEAGGYVYVPGEEAHTFLNRSAQPARLLVVAVPGGFEEFFRAVAAATADGQMPDPETMARLNAEHGVRFV